jgi:hypothetical protein
MKDDGVILVGEVEVKGAVTDSASVQMVDGADSLRILHGPDLKWQISEGGEAYKELLSIGPGGLRVRGRPVEMAAGDVAALEGVLSEWSERQQAVFAKVIEQERSARVPVRKLVSYMQPGERVALTVFHVMPAGDRSAVFFQETLGCVHAVKNAEVEVLP